MGTISLTPSAVEALKRKLEERGTPNAMLRVGVRGGGCSGYSYVLEFFDGEPRKRDVIFGFDGASVVCDKKSLAVLDGCTLDWEKRLIYTGFKWINPQEKTRCGCGVSFSV